MTVEKKVAEAILQEPIKITLNGSVYEVERPRVGTMIKASGFIGELPQGKVSDDEYLATLLNPKYYEAIVNAMIVLVCGINGKYKKEKVREDILQEYDDKLLSGLISILSTLNSEVFFSLITFLHGVNITKPTKTTASGQPLADLQNTTD